MGCAHGRESGFSRNIGLSRRGRFGRDESGRRAHLPLAVDEGADSRHAAARRTLECRDDSGGFWRHGSDDRGCRFLGPEICSRTRGYAPSSHCSGALPPGGSRQRGRTERERALVRLIRAAPSVAGSIPTEASRSPLPTRLPCEFFPPNSLSSTAEPPEGR